MQHHTIFETDIWLDHWATNYTDMVAAVQHHHCQQPTVQISNQGGYQGHEFVHAPLFEAIRARVPQRPDCELTSFGIQAWANINGPGHWNDVHDHSGAGILLSGIYYVWVTERTGGLRIYDRRSGSADQLFANYYKPKQGNWIRIQPEKGQMWFFPPGTPHMVEPNTDWCQRVSIAFNIVDPVWAA
jgi:hypothetical protein